MATRTELIQKVLEKLGVLSSGETVSASDSNTVGDAYDELYEELRQERLVNWGSADSIPNEAVRPMVALVAFDLLSAYGIGGEQSAGIRSEYQLARARLAKAMSESFTPSNVNPDYF